MDGDARLRSIESFAGRWTLARAIEDHRRGELSHVIGQASFAPRPGGLAYHETGQLHLPGRAPLFAERRYLWDAGSGGQIVVRFTDGAPFHSFDPAEAEPRAEHLCGEDHYTVRYRFPGGATLEAGWHCDWAVTGPRKDYRIVTRYRRIG